MRETVLLLGKKGKKCVGVCHFRRRLNMYYIQVFSHLFGVADEEETELMRHRYTASECQEGMAGCQHWTSFYDGNTSNRVDNSKLNIVSSNYSR